MKNPIAVHIASVLSAATAVIALVHPGFQLPPFVQGLSVVVAGGIAFALQAIHYISQHKKHLLTDAVAAAAKQIEATKTASA